MRGALYRLYRVAQRRLVPELRYAQTTYEEHLDAAVHPGIDWLDLGCGHQLLPPWRREAERWLVARARRVVGLDPTPAVRNHTSIRHGVQGDGTHLPFAAASFDLVTANMVVEHLPDPLGMFREVARVLKPGGQFLFHTPNARGHATRLARAMPEWLKRLGVWLLEGRAEADRFRTHYRANTEAALRALAEQAGLGVVACRFTGSTAMFALVVPLAVVELLWIRQTLRRWPQYRTNLIVALRRAA